MITQYRMHSFQDAELMNLLQEFRNSVHRTKVNDARLADEIEEQLIRRRRGDLDEETLKRLSRWCKTGYLFKDGMPVAQQISRLLYGVVVDREVLRT